MIENGFDVAFIARLALHEKQIQQNYRPVIAVHKWFARRPGTLFRGLMLSEFIDKPLVDTFYRANRLSGIKIADPFMGGGTPLLEANRLGCDVLGLDINPMAYWIVRQEIEHLDLKSYLAAASALREGLEAKVGDLYRTRCTVCHSGTARVKYFLWVKTLPCQECGRDIDLFPGYLLASNSRHPNNVFVCPSCGELTETADRQSPGRCRECGAGIAAAGPARYNRCLCRHCGTVNPFPRTNDGPPPHRLFAIEYFCPDCRGSHAGRFFKTPDAHDLERTSRAEQLLAGMETRFVPADEIPAGVETDRLHRWGYRRYREMFNSRQLAGLELSARLVAATADERIRNALATNISDLLRYQNMLCRYDTTALKSLDIFSIHGFPVGLIQCESNLPGIVDPDRNLCVGSGGWANIIEKYRKAKYYCGHPFEIRHHGTRKEAVPVQGEWIGDTPGPAHPGENRQVIIECRDAAGYELPPASLDAVFTDPPYFGNVQYAELMDFCYVWLRRLLESRDAAFRLPSTRNPQELTGNENMGRGLAHFTQGLSAVFRRMATALKPGAPLVFTYHHNSPEAYFPVATALLDAGLVCSASLPCPAEMGASIHINRTGSSIIDTVFVCRSTGKIPRKTLPDDDEGVIRLIREDLAKLRAGGVNPSKGDIRCIAFGHLTRLAVWNLRRDWMPEAAVANRLEAVSGWMEKSGRWARLTPLLQGLEDPETSRRSWTVREETGDTGGWYDEISF